MVNVKYSIAMSEVLHYLKGIRQEDINKIPRNFMIFLEENASKKYICQFDYNKPLRELKLLDETRGIISTICLNYWCETEEQKKNYINRLNENERKYQEKLREKYTPDNIFKNQNVDTALVQEKAVFTEKAMVEYKKTIFNRIRNWFKNLFSRK